ncbi:O-antigen polymerase [Vibrio cyclitrophicus]|uniref:O-antigen polymerase n=1 Tax=Vibrio cyclitrophicus TaxID=47951 RepID=UPI0003119137|nr:O-antigen polymerase [Vibrio cyclitrophicus]
MIYSIEEKLLAIFFSILILLCSYTVRLRVKSWQNPCSILSLFWFLYTFFPLVILFNVSINLYAIIYIFCAIISFSIPTLFFKWEQPSHPKGLDNFFKLDKIFGLLCFLQAFTIITVVFDILANGFSMHDIIFNLMDVSNSYMSLRYTDEVKVSIFSGMANVTNYTVAILGGLVYIYLDRNRKLVCVLLVFIPSLIIMLVQAAKGTLFLCLVLFFFSFSLARSFERDEGLLPKGFWKGAIVGLTIFLPAIVSSFLSRGLYQKGLDEAISGLFYYFNSYALAHLYAFSDWFSYYIGDSSLLEYKDYNGLQFGFYSFMPLFRLMGVDKIVPPGVYEEYFYINDILQSNIYTVFRGGVLDFSLGGMLIVMFVFGVILNGLFWLLRRGRYLFFVIPVLVMFTGFSYSSFIISLFIWNSSYAAVILSGLILYYIRVRSSAHE